MHKGRYLIVKFPAEQVEGAVRVSRGIHVIPSAVTGDIYLKGNRIFALVRFHDSQLRDVSRLLSQGLQLVRGSRIEYMGRSHGKISALNRLNESIELIQVSFDTTRPGGTYEDTRLDHYAEAGVQFLAEERFNAVLYPDRPDEWKLETGLVSAEDGVYTMSVKGLFTAELFGRALEQNIPLGGLIFRSVEDRVRSTILLPKVFKEDFLKTLYQVAEHLPDLGFTLAAVRGYSAEIWDFI